MAEIKYLDKTGLGTVKSILDGLYAPKTHNHNSLYYTKTESDNLLSGKSNTTHTHDYLSKTQYGYSIDTYRFDVGQNDRGWVHLGYFYGSNSGIKIDCDYTSHCAPSYGICDSSITFGIRNATFEGYISKNAGTGSGLYITESKDSGYKYYHVYIYLKAWLQGHVRIQDLGSSSAFVWNISNEEPDSTYNVILDCRSLNGFYALHDGKINKVIDEGNISSQTVSYATAAGSAVDQTARDAASAAQTTANGKWTYDSSKFLRRDDTQGSLSKFVLEDIPKNVTQVGSIGWTDYQNYPHAGGLWMTLKGSSSLRTALILFPTYNMSHPPILYSSIDNGAWQGGHTLAYRSDIPTNNNQLTNGAGYITGITKTMVTNALGYTPPSSDTNTWLGDGSWAPGTNVKLSATANNQEWSFDIERNGKTGCHWHVWDSTLSSLLKITADDGIVEAPYGFKGSLSGNASSATLLKPNSGITTNVATWNPLSSFTKCWGQNFTSSSLSSDTGDILYYLRRGDSGYGSTSTTELCVCIDGDYYGKGGGGTPQKVSYDGHTHTKSQITDFPASLPANGGIADSAARASYLAKCVSSVTATTRSTDHGYSMALFTSGWASNSAGFHTTYGTTLDLSGYSTWYHRLAFGTDGQIEHWMGINTNTLTNQGRLCYTNHSHTTFNSLTINGSVSASSGFFDTSDERLKDIIDNVNVDIDKLSELRKVYFNFKNDTDKKHIGVIAQDIQKIYPEIVEENDEGMLTVDYSKLSIIALDAVDQLNQKNKELENRLNKIENLLKDKGIL